MCTESAVSTAVAWYALKTRSRHEKLVAQALRERGVTCVCPLMRQRNRWSDRLQVVEVPLFSTYVFVQIDPLERVDVLCTRGAVAILGAGGVPTPVADHEIDALIMLALAGAPLEPHRFLRQGQRVRVRGGPFRGIEGTLVRADGKSKIVIAVDLIKRAAALEIDAADVEGA